jgi:hypothetical protein
VSVRSNSQILLEERLNDAEMIQKLRDIKIAIQDCELWLSIVPEDHRKNIAKYKTDIESFNMEIAAESNVSIKNTLMNTRKSYQNILTSLEAVTPQIQKLQSDMEHKLKFLREMLLEDIVGKRDTGEPE